MLKFIQFEKQVSTFLTGNFQLALIQQTLPDSSSGSRILQLTFPLCGKSNYQVQPRLIRRGVPERLQAAHASTHINQSFPNSIWLKTADLAIKISWKTSWFRVSVFISHLDRLWRTESEALQQVGITLLYYPFREAGCQEKQKYYFYCFSNIEMLQYEQEIFKHFFELFLWFSLEAILLARLCMASIKIILLCRIK